MKSPPSKKVGDKKTRMQPGIFSADVYEGQNQEAMSFEPDQKAVVLTHAMLKAGSLLGLQRSELANVVGISTASLNRYARGDAVLRERTKQWELACILVSAYQSASLLVGHDEALLRKWMSSYNRALGTSPKDAAATVQGLAAVACHLNHALVLS